MPLSEETKTVWNWWNNEQ